MKNLKKLKSVLATELENREVYAEAFDLVKDAEVLEKHIKDLGAQAKAEEVLVKKYKNQAEKAKENALKLEKDYSDRAAEMEDLLKKQVEQAEKQSEGMVVAARDEKAGLKKDISLLQKKIKALEARELEAVSQTDAAEKKLDAIRAKLKSI